MLHRAPVRSASFSPDGRSLLSTGADGEVRLWDAATGLPIGPGLAQDGPLAEASFLRDGRRVLASGAGEVRLWKTPWLTEWKAPEDLHDAALLAAVGRIGPAGAFESLSPERWRSLARRH